MPVVALGKNIRLIFRSYYMQLAHIKAGMLIKHEEKLVVEDSNTVMINELRETLNGRTTIAGGFNKKDVMDIFIYYFINIILKVLYQ